MIGFGRFFIGRVGAGVIYLYAITPNCRVRFLERHATQASALASLAWWRESGRLA